MSTVPASLATAPSRISVFPFTLVDRGAPRGGAILGAVLLAIPWALGIALWFILT